MFIADIKSAEECLKGYIITSQKYLDPNFWSLTPLPNMRKGTIQM
jgi:hypothetical protein